MGESIDLGLPIFFLRKKRCRLPYVKNDDILLNKSIIAMYLHDVKARAQV